MQTLSDPHRLHQLVNQWRLAGERVAFVPTMGNLHDGHIELVHQARARADRVVASIFVNPMQFGAGEDLDAYPRTLDADKTRLFDAGCDLLFTPEVSLLYPAGLGQQTYVEVPGLSDLHCGASRPGHFRGVTTIVCKLFNLVQPDIACFGQKDYQQLAVIRAMVRDLNMPVEVIGIPTVREADGLAMSSRNGYLTKSERSLAPELKRTLDITAQAIPELGLEQRAELEQQAEQRLADRGFEPDFFRICQAHTLAPAQPGDTELVILAAAQLGRARLIDNLQVDLPH
ncbi:pantoate--beta-alanine ligase [Ferrimonas balearica]|uniref:pantoate--beta-alanine ligase n=1 Tax=Ferrimonas balearica TaxID=44012 RepID=UPI001C99C060|nr:pantoate--beta-alanine ligase [Ferrimonas balearica]MBY5993661.1 pantoate--beta-alanine ligase [Ferrimonas balearica]